MNENNTIVSAVPGGEMAEVFEHADISVIQIDADNWIPDFDPDPFDLALVQVQDGMCDREVQNLATLRACIDWPAASSRMFVGLENFGPGMASDVALAAILNHPLSPFGIQYAWAPGDPFWPDGLTVVHFRQTLYTRTGNTLTIWGEE